MLSLFFVGDRVVVEPMTGCGSCDLCKEGKRNACNKLSIIGVHQDGGLSDRFIVPEYTLHKLPDTIDDQMGVLTEPLAVSVHAFRTMGFEIGKESNRKILIMGSGTIGLTCLAVAAFFGIKSIAITAKYPFQIEVAKKLGNALGLELFVYNSNLEGLETPPDVIIETVGGHANTISDAIKHIKNCGKIAMLGVFIPGNFSINLLTLLMKHVSLIASNCYDRSVSPNDFEVALQILKQNGQMLKKILITHTFTLDQISDAFNTASSKGDSKAIKVVVQIGEIAKL